MFYTRGKYNKKMTEEHTQTNDVHEEERARKVQSLREMISSAERTIQGAKAMLLQLEGKKKVGRRRKFEDEADGTVIEGIFDGQIMIGTDGKQYPVPANYASKSKLVEGDHLKLTITPDGSFIYKQIGPIDRQNIIGIVSQDEIGNYYVVADGKPYKILLASITYFKAAPGDEVVIIVPRGIESAWAAMENVLHRTQENSSRPPEQKASHREDTPSSSGSMVDEWVPDMAEIEKEIKEEMQAEEKQ